MNFEVVSKVDQFYTGLAPSLSETGDFMVCACGDQANVVDLKAGGSVLCRAEPRGGSVTAVVWVPFCAEIVVATQSMQLHHFKWMAGNAGGPRGTVASGEPDSGGSDEDDGRLAVLVRSWKAHAAPVSMLAADSKGALVASGAPDRSVLVWDLRQRHCTHSFGPLSGLPTALTFHPDPDRLALMVGASDGVVLDYDLVTGQPQRMESHSSACSGIAFAGNWTAVTAGREGVLCVWDLRRHQLLRSIACGERSEGVATVVAYTKPAIAGVDDGGASGDKQRKRRRREKSALGTAGTPPPAARPHYFAAVAGGETGRVKLFDVDTGRCVGQESPSPACVPYVSLSGPVVRPTAAGSPPGSAERPSSGVLLLLGAMIDHSVGLLQVDGNQALAGLTAPGAPSPSDTTVRCLRRLVGDNDEITDVRFASVPVAANRDAGVQQQQQQQQPPQTASVLMTTNSPVARLYALPGHGCQFLVGHTEPILCVDVDVVRQVAVTGSKDNTVRVWQLAHQPRCLAVCTGHGAAVTATACVPATGGDADGSLLVISGAGDHTLKVWKTALTGPSAREIAVDRAEVTVAAHTKDINGLAVAPNGRMAASCSADKTIRLWRVRDLGAEGVLRGHRRGVWSVQFAPADRLLLSSSADGTLKLWNLSSLACLRTFEGHEGSALKAVFVPPLGAELASTGSDGLLKLWSVRSGECLGTFDQGHEHQAKLWALAATATTAPAPLGDEAPDGDDDAAATATPPPCMLVTGGSDARLRVWRDCTAVLAEAAQRQRQEQLLAVQQLENFVRANQLDQALAVALELCHPGRVLRVLQALGAGDQLERALAALTVGQLTACVRFAAAWNTRATHAHLANAVVSAALRRLGWRQFADAVLHGDNGSSAANGSTGSQSVPPPSSKQSGSASAPAPPALLHRDAVSLLVAIQAYNKRHAARLERMLRQSFELDFLLANIGQLDAIL